MSTTCATPLLHVIKIFVIPNAYVKWQPDDDEIQTTLNAEVEDLAGGVLLLFFTHQLLKPPSYTSSE